MKTFKRFLLEYLTDQQRERYKGVDMSDKARADTDHFFGVGNDKVHNNLHTMTDKSEIHKKVENHINRELTHDEYISGLTKDNYGRNVRLGRMIKDPQLRDEFARDPVREGSKKAQTQYTTSTVRGVEVAGQTNSRPNEQHPRGHSWGGISCKNVDTGMNKHYLDDEIEHGTVAHFVHDHNGQEIYRATLQPYHNEHGHVAYSLDSEYGIKHPKFTEDAHRVAAELSSPHGDRTTSYHKHPDVYDDNRTKVILHPATTAEDLHHVIRSQDFAAVKAATDHRNLNADHLQHILDNNRHPIIRQNAARHPSMTSDLLHDALRDSNIHVARAAASNPNMKDEHFKVAMNHRDAEVRSVAAEHPNMGYKHMEIAAHDPHPMVRQALHRNPSTPANLVHEGLKDQNEYVRVAAVKNRHTTKEQVAQMQSDPKSVVRAAAVANPNIDISHIKTASRDHEPVVRIVAAKHPLAAPLLHSFLGDKDSNVHEAVAQNPKAKIEHLHRAMNSAYSHVRWRAVEHPNADRDLIQRGLEDHDEDVRDTAFNHPKLDDEHIAWAAKYGKPNIKRRARELLENHES